MSNDKIQSEMLFPDLIENKKTDIIDRLMSKPPYHNLSNADLVEEAANEIRDLREAVNDLTAWSEGVEADNDTLRKEIARLQNKIANASILLADWDGYWNPVTKTGCTEELARLIEEAYRSLQNGKSWHNTNP
jgi:hypothetical protein